MQQIADWLEKLGLGQYAQRFAENDISFPILPDLTDQDLKELGVSSLGHRRQLLRAIAELHGVQKTNAPGLAPTETPTALHDTAERPTSLEAFGRLVDRLRTLGVLLVVTHRPEFEPPWIGRPYVTALTLYCDRPSCLAMPSRCPSIFVRCDRRDVT